MDKFEILWQSTALTGFTEVGGLLFYIYDVGVGTGIFPLLYSMLPNWPLNYSVLLPWQPIPTWHWSQ